MIFNDPRLSGVIADEGSPSPPHRVSAEYGHRSVQWEYGYQHRHLCMDLVDTFITSVSLKSGV